MISKNKSFVIHVCLMIIVTAVFFIIINAQNQNARLYFNPIVSRIPYNIYHYSEVKNSGYIQKAAFFYYVSSIILIVVFSTSYIRDTGEKSIYIKPKAYILYVLIIVFIGMWLVGFPDPVLTPTAQISEAHAKPIMLSAIVIPATEYVLFSSFLLSKTE